MLFTARNIFTALRTSNLKKAILPVILLLSGQPHFVRPATECVAQQATANTSPLLFDQLIYDERQRQLVLVNGYRHPDRPELGQLWGWDGKEWKLIPASGPSMRTVSAAVYDSRRKRIVLYGGLGNAGLNDQRGDTWEWDGKSWQQMADASIGTRDHHALAYDAARGKTVLFGGVASDRNSPTETWEWDGTKWTKIAAPGPGGRGGIGLVYDDERKQVILFGGVGQDAKRLGDTWAWDGKTWRQVSAEGPLARNGAGLAFDRRAGVVILFGGTAGSQHFDDLWQWDGQRWTEIKVTGPKPGKRVGPGITYDVARGKIVLYGGMVRENGQVKASDEMWEWSGKQWAQIK